ncbi:unnamed protein product [Staurois parvus]|uniref:Uncharacterized protein n=1 Tax=Staurois parvus TaxID=386267 RepID=A0ABN9AB30_9NEOB|nr:unnamed protein product [Staurois parvus]
MCNMVGKPGGISKVSASRPALPDERVRPGLILSCTCSETRCILMTSDATSCP